MPDNLYRRGKVWCARFWLNGEEIRRSLKTTSRAVAMKERDKIAQEIERARRGEERRAWPDAILGWAAAAPGQIKPNVIKRYRVSLRQVNSILEPLFLDQIDRKVLRSIAHRVGVTNATRRRDLTAVSSVLSWCVAEGWLETNLAKQFDRTHLPERRDPIVLPETGDIAAVIAAAPGNLGKLARLAQLTGMRQDEMVTLEWYEHDAKRQAVNLSKTKTNRPRSVPLVPAATAVLTGAARHISSPYIFWVLGDDGAAGPQNNVSGRFAELVRRVERREKAAGRSFRRFRFHDLRHWFAVEYLRTGGSIYRLQKILGHSSIQTTEIYLDYLTPEEADAAKAGTAEATR
jgi:integrase/recombinase XerD